MGALINVQVYRGGQMVAQHQFDSDQNRTIKIGRLSSAQVKLEDPKVSRIHAVLELAGADVSLHDMGTTEGTSVNGAKVVNAKLKSGDQVMVGDTTLVITTGAAAVAAPPAQAAPAQAMPMAAAAPAGAPFGTGSFPAARPGGSPFAAPGAAPAFGGMPAFGAPAAQAPAPAPAAQPGARPGRPAPNFAAPPAWAQPVPQQASVPAGVPPIGAAVQNRPSQPRFDPGAAAGSAQIRRITQDRLGAAAVESKPHPALAPERPMSADNRVLELRLYWGEVLLGINHYLKPKKITIGETKKTNIFISSEGLPVEEFPLVRTIDDEYVFGFSSHMDGEVEIDGQLTSLEQLRGSSVAKKDDALSETFQVRLPPSSRAIVHWGGATFALRFVAPSEGIKRKFAENMDLHFLNVAVMSLFFHIALIVTLLVYPYDTESLREDLFDKPDRFASLILEPPKEKDSNKNLLEKIKKEVEQKKEEIAKTKPPEDVPKPTKQVLTKITDIKPPVKHTPTKEERESAVREKMTKLFASGGGGGAAGGGSLLGGGGGGSLSGTLAGVIGTAGTGSATAGMAGLGIRGGGPLTGGGVGTSRGIAGIGTSGRLGGGGLGYGSGVGLGGRRERGALDIGPPRIEGALPMEVIKKVIDENKNQIKYCYETELQRDQNLEGRVAMTWVISATGSVATAQVRESTIRNGNVERCIVEKIKTWKFPAPAGGGVVTVNYPFIFKAS
jgi:TonB family protein